MLTANDTSFVSNVCTFICYAVVNAEVSRLDFIRAAALSFSLAVRGKCFDTISRLCRVVAFS